MLDMPAKTPWKPLFDGSVFIRAHGWNPKGISWSMRTIEDLYFTEDDRPITIYAGAYGTKNVWSPTPSTCNALIADRDPLKWKQLHRSRVTLYRGPEADGVTIFPGEGYAVSPADCPTVLVMCTDGRLICCHAGRDSIVDMQAFKDGREPGPRLAHNIAEAVGSTEERALAQVYIGFSGISAGKHFAHDPTNEKHSHNRRLVNWVEKNFGPEGFAKEDGALEGGWIDLHSILWHQLVALGFAPELVQIEMTCTYRDLNQDGNPAWFSNARGDKERNLLIVHYLSERVSSYLR